MPMKHPFRTNPTTPPRPTKKKKKNYKKEKVLVLHHDLEKGLKKGKEKDLSKEKSPRRGILAGCHLSLVVHVYYIFGHQVAGGKNKLLMLIDLF